MNRDDLLALSMEDLTSLTNRGTVKRASLEQAKGELKCEFKDAKGELMVAWSDGITCVFPAGKTIHDAQCTSGVVGISRHIVRSVLAYQVHCLEKQTSENGKEDSTPKGPPWDPGQVTDKELIKQFRQSAVTRARKVFDKGVLAELTRGAKPVARFLHESCTVRFPVPGDLRYATADCAETLLPQWICMAVWAFREFDSQRVAGLLAIQQSELPTPHAELNQVDSLLAELFRDGLANISEALPQRIARLEKKIRNHALVWPAELMLEMLHEIERYKNHDARFELAEMVRIIGEWIARSRAIQTQNGSVPQPLIRGTKSDRRTDIKAGRFVGVGLGVKPGRRHTVLNAYLQDSDTGSVVTIQRTASDPEPESGESPKSFVELANQSLANRASLGSISLSQVLLGAGKRTPTNELVLPRGSGKFSTNPQSFQWEQLKAPFAAENFSQLRQRIESLPPDWLRPLRQTENLHVVSITGVADADFDVVSQRLTATLSDSNGDRASLVHSYHFRGAEGFNHLATVLKSQGAAFRFVCGHVRLVGSEMIVNPVSLVLEEDGERIAICPWITEESAIGEVAAKEENDLSKVPVSPIADFLTNLNRGLSETLMTGLSQTSQAHWTELAQAAHRYGFIRLAASIESLERELANRANQVRWKAGRSERQFGEICMYARIIDSLA